MLYGEIRPGGHFRFVNFGHPPPLVFSAEFEMFMEIDEAGMVQFLALGLEIPEDHPDRNKYLSMALRPRQINSRSVGDHADESRETSCSFIRTAFTMAATRRTGCRLSE